MKLEDLGTINLSADRPPIDMTDDQWQDYFSRMKLLVTPSKDKKLKYKNISMTINGTTIDSSSSYCGETQWYYYCQTINSILDSIRHKERDYCYNIYQVSDLLRFEHDRLVTRWLPEDRCIEVWLN